MQQSGALSITQFLRVNCYYLYLKSSLHQQKAIVVYNEYIHIDKWHLVPQSICKIMMDDLMSTLGWYTLNKVCIVIIEWVPTNLAVCVRVVVLHSRWRLWAPRRCHRHLMRQNIRCSEFILRKQLHGIMQTLPASPAERVVENHNVCNHNTYLYTWNPYFSLPILGTNCTTGNAVRSIKSTERL